MCLSTKQMCPLRAQKDIVCYKIFTYSFDEFHMMTPYLRKHVLRPTKNNPTLMDDTDFDVEINNATVKYPDGRICKVKCIGYGMIHAYTQPRILCGPGGFLYKCIIPKNTLYYKGMFGDICAKKMLVVEQVK